MTRETYEQHLRESGTPVSLADAAAFTWHSKRCPVCKVSKYSYQRCPEGLKLAQKMAGIDVKRRLR